MLRLFLKSNRSDGGPSGVEVLVRSLPEQTVGRLFDSLGVDDATIDGHRIDRDVAIADSGLLDGSTLETAKQLNTSNDLTSSSFQLVFADGTTKKLKPGTTVLGRSKADVNLDDPEVSRRHAAISVDGKHCVIADLGSRNGTRVDGSPLTEETILTHGSAIQIGSQTIWLSDESQGPLAYLNTKSNAPVAGKWPLFGGSVRVGRSPSCDIAIDHESVSAVHLKLSFDGVRWLVEDLDSMNGVEVDAKPIVDITTVSTESVLRLGDVELQLSSSAATLPESLMCVAGADAGSVWNKGAATIRPALAHRGAKGSITYDPSAETSGNGSKFIDLPGGDLRLVGGSVVKNANPTAYPPGDFSAPGDGSLRYNKAARIRAGDSAQRVEFPAEPLEPTVRTFSLLEALIPVVGAVVISLALQQPRFLVFGLLSPFLVGGRFLAAKKQAAKKLDEDTQVFERDHAFALEELDQAKLLERQNLEQRYPPLIDLLEVGSKRLVRLWERRPTDADFLHVRVGVCTAQSQAELVGPSTEAVSREIPFAPSIIDLREAGVVAVAGRRETRSAVARSMIMRLAVLHSPRDLRIFLLSPDDHEQAWRGVTWLPHLRGESSSGPVSWIANRPEILDEHVRRIDDLIRQRVEASKGSSSPVFSPECLVVLDGARDLRTHPLMPQMLVDGPAVGVRFLALDEDLSRTPAEARAVVDLTGSHPVLQVDGTAPAQDFIADELHDLELLERAARSILPVEEIAATGVSQLASSVRLIDAMDIDIPSDSAQLVDDWQRTVPSVNATLGLSSTGLFSVDLAKEGPHGLVAGTTGAGKSELLLTMIYTLCRANRPDQFGFILIDYKGGADYEQIQRLPHAVALVTNLEQGRTRRVIDSLRIETNRRTQVLKDMVAMDLISEANVVKAWEENPEGARKENLGRLMLVVDEFGELAQFDPDFVRDLVSVTRTGRSVGLHLILATQNPTGQVTADMQSNIGLRITLRTEKGQSREVLGSDHADHVMRSQPGRGWVRVSAPERKLVEFQTARVAGLNATADTEAPPPEVHQLLWEQLGYPPPGPAGQKSSSQEGTDISLLVAQCIDAAGRLGNPRLKCPWAPELPSLIPAVEGSPEDRGLGVIFGTVDDVATQSQPPLRWSLSDSENLCVVGRSGSGRTTTLRTVALGLATSHNADELILHTLDGIGGLSALAALPHSGTSLRLEQRGLVDRFIRRLLEEHTSRQRLLTAKHVGDLSELRRIEPAVAPPLQLVLVDSWEQLAENFDSDSAVMQGLIKLLREGRTTGVRIIATGDSKLASSARTRDRFGMKLILPLSTMEGYRDLGLSRQVALPPDIAGRCLVHPDLVEAQIAVVSAEDPSAFGQQEHIRKRAREMRSSTNGVDRLVVAELPSLVDHTQILDSPGRLTIGVHGDDAQPWSLDPERIHPGLLAVGKSESGVSTFLRTFAAAAKRENFSVLAISTGPEHLEATSDIWFPMSGLTAKHVDDALQQLDQSRCVVVVDRPSKLPKEVADFLKKWSASRLPGQALVVLGERPPALTGILTGILKDIAGLKTGLLMSPEGGSGNPFANRLGPSFMAPGVKGRAVYFREGEPVTSVQIAQ